MKQKGFTIVEIIIVITVIGILAAIAIVSYNGIVQRANNAQTVEAVRQWAEALQTYEADHPESLPTILVNEAACLGEGYPSVAGKFSLGECVAISGGGSLSESSTLNSQMKDYLDGGIPNPSFQETSIVPGNPYGWSSGDFRGIMTNSLGGGSVSLIFFQAGASSCPSLGNNLSSEPVEGLFDGGVACAVVVDG